MKIAFATPLSARASTIIGRVSPMAHELEQRGHDVHVLLLGTDRCAAGTTHSVGSEPFTREAGGKRRLSGLDLILNMMSTAWRTRGTLLQLKPDVVIAVKPLPNNTCGVLLAKWSGLRAHYVLDTDDFELSANALTSFIQRAAVHWAERTAAGMAATIFAASPFLVDHFKQLTGGVKKVHLLPTGLTLAANAAPNPSAPGQLLYIGSVSKGSGHIVEMLPDILEEVRKHVADCTLVIAGDGDSVDDVQKLFEQKGLTKAVTWLGRFDAATIHEHVHPNAILLDPVDTSIAVRAKSSYRVALATALGVAVITSDVGIRPHLIPQSLHARLLVPATGAKEYAAYTVNILRQPLTIDERDALKGHAEQFTWSTLVDEVIQQLQPQL